MRDKEGGEEEGEKDTAYNARLAPVEEKESEEDCQGGFKSHGLVLKGSFW